MENEKKNELIEAAKDIAADIFNLGLDAGPDHSTYLDAATDALYQFIDQIKSA